MRGLSALLWGQAGMLLRSAICFGVSILLARSLGTEAFGVYSALVGFVALVLLLTDLGIYSVFSNFLPRFEAQERPGAASYLIRRVVTIRMALLLGVGGLLFAFAAPVASLTGIEALPDLIGIVLAWMLVRALADAFVFLVTSQMRMRLFAVVETTVSLLQLCGVIVLARQGLEILPLLVLMVGIYGLQAVGYVAATRESFLAPPERPDVAPIVRYGAIMWLCGATQRFLQSDIDLLMIMKLVGDESQVGFYGIAYLLATTGGFLLVGSLGALTLPILSRAHASGGLPAMQEAWQLLYKASLLLTAPVFVYTALHAESIVVALYSPAYAQAAPLLACFAVLYGLGTLLGCGPSVTVLLPLGKESWVLALRGGGGVLNVALNGIAIPRWGVTGAVLATGLTYLLVAAAELAVMLRRTGFRVDLRFLARVTPIVILPALPTLLPGAMNLLQLVAVAALYGVVTVILTLRFCGPSAREAALLRDAAPGLAAWLARLRLLPAAGEGPAA